MAQYAETEEMCSKNRGRERKKLQQNSKCCWNCAQRQRSTSAGTNQPNLIKGLINYRLKLNSTTVALKKQDSFKQGMQENFFRRSTKLWPERAWHIFFHNRTNSAGQRVATHYLIKFGFWRQPKPNEGLVVWMPLSSGYAVALSSTSLSEAFLSQCKWMQSTHGCITGSRAAKTRRNTNSLLITRVWSYFKMTHSIHLCYGRNNRGVILDHFHWLTCLDLYTPLHSGNWLGKCLKCLFIFQSFKVFIVYKLSCI